MGGRIKCMDSMKQNTHIEHPEDSILNGDLSVLDWFSTDSIVSVKIDGAPAIVWGTNPANGQFFVGTKSVFNKKKIKINHSHDEIDTHHDGDLAEILHNCFDFLPRCTSIYQGDFIGFGGCDIYTPNTLTYIFEEVISAEIIIAPHTEYIVGDIPDLREVSAILLTHRLGDTPEVLFVKPYAKLSDNIDEIKSKCDFAKVIAASCEFPEQKVVNKLKKQINTCIREDITLDEMLINILAHDNKVDINVMRLWKLVESIKIDMLSYILVDNSLLCEFDGEPISHEGIVMTNKYGTFKIIDREVFSYLNFKVGGVA